MPYNQYEASHNFYKGRVAPMIREQFEEYESRIAVGIAGEGSDCFGYDDYVSRDHDFGTGVCLWLSDEDMELFGDELGKAYDALIDTHPGNNLTARLIERRGVMTIRKFYNNILECDCYNANNDMSADTWLALNHTCLATAVNGEVFRDDLGAFSSFRRVLLSYYPDTVWKIRIIDELHRFAQAMQVNYARCMSRGDTVAARQCHAEGLDSAMQLFFLMKREYAPYYKWTFRRLEEIDDSEFAPLIKELAEANLNGDMWDLGYDATFLNVNDPIVRLSERIASRIVAMMRDNNLTDGRSPYLENYVDDLLKEVAFSCALE